MSLIMRTPVQRYSEELAGTVITRRNLLVSAATVAALPRSVRAQARKPTIPVKSLSHMTLTVTDPKRSLEFYQGLFGMNIQARQGPTVVLGIGRGPEFIALTGGPNAKPGINHYCMTTPNFNPDRVMGILAEHGITKAEGAAGPGGGLSGGAMKARVRIRGESAGGAK